MTDAEEVRQQFGKKAFLVQIFVNAFLLAAIVSVPVMAAITDGAVLLNPNQTQVARPQGNFTWLTIQQNYTRYNASINNSFNNPPPTFAIRNESNSLLFWISSSGNNTVRDNIEWGTTVEANGNSIMNLSVLDFNNEWDIEQQDRGGISRLVLESQLSQSNAELFMNPKGANDVSQFTLSSDSSPNTYNGLELHADDGKVVFNSTVEGNEPVLPMHFEMDGNRTITIHPNGNVTFHGAFWNMMNNTLADVNKTLYAVNGLAPYQEGTIFYDDESDSMVYYNDNDQVTVNLGQELVVPVKNMEGSTLEDGDVVFVSGSVGGSDELEVKCANASSIMSTDFLGVMTTTTAKSEDGYMTIQGRVRGVNTSGFSSGDKLYLGTNDCEITSTAPTYPDYAVRIGRVGRSNSNTGTIDLFKEAEFDQHQQPGGVFFADENGVIATNNTRILYNQTTNQLILDAGASLNMTGGNIEDAGDITSDNASFSDTVTYRGEEIDQRYGTTSGFSGSVAYGPGLDGSLSLSGDTDLGDDEHIKAFTNLSLNGHQLRLTSGSPSGTLFIFVSDTLDCGNGGTINMTTLGGPQGGNGGSSSAAGGDGGDGGGPSAGSIFISARNIEGTSCIFESNGGDGADGGDGAAPGLDSGGAAGDDGADLTFFDAPAGVGGGGNGEAPFGNTGSDGTVRDSNYPGYKVPRLLTDPFGVSESFRSSSANMRFTSPTGGGGAEGVTSTTGGAGGGAGGGGGCHYNTTGTTKGGRGADGDGTSASGGGGGGGGGAGGIITLVTEDTDDLSFITIEATGGDGGDGGNGNNGGGGVGGGGAGGCGGFVSLMTPHSDHNIVVNVSGGLGGSFGASGSTTNAENGPDGPDGHVIEYIH